MVWVGGCFGWVGVWMTRTVLIQEAMPRRSGSPGTRRSRSPGTRRSKSPGTCTESASRGPVGRSTARSPPRKPTERAKSSRARTPPVVQRRATLSPIAFFTTQAQLLTSSQKQTQLGGRASLHQPCSLRNRVMLWGVGCRHQDAGPTARRGDIMRDLLDHSLVQHLSAAAFGGSRRDAADAGTPVSTIIPGRPHFTSPWASSRASLTRAFSHCWTRELWPTPSARSSIGVARLGTWHKLPSGRLIAVCAAGLCGVHDH